MTVLVRNLPCRGVTKVPLRFLPRWQHLLTTRSAACETTVRPEPAVTTSASPTTTDWHRRQRDLVAASLIAVPAAKRPTHRRWA